MSADSSDYTPTEAEHQYGIDHRHSSIHTTDDDGDEFTGEDHVALEFDEQGYGPNARIVRRAVGPWEEAQRDEDGFICDWTLAIDWNEVAES